MSLTLLLILNEMLSNHELLQGKADPLLKWPIDNLVTMLFQGKPWLWWRCATKTLRHSFGNAVPQHMHDQLKSC